MHKTANATLKSFLQEELDILALRGWVAIIYMGTPLVLSFAVIDYFYVPSQWIELLGIRLSVIPATLFYYILTRANLLTLQWRLNLYALYLGFYTSILVTQTGFENSVYYAGFNLVAIVSVTFLPWSPKHLAINIICLYLPYFVTIFYNYNKNFHWGIFITNASFCISTILVCSMCWYLIRKMRKKEYQSRIEIDELVEFQEQTIKRKTRESVLLHKLSRQFSDETIRLVKEGAINLDARERRYITCIFLDIEESSSKANAIDHREYLELLDNFFNTCTEVLIRHNITVGTFLGDGLLAFSNAPVNVEDHEVKAAQACLEILEKRRQLSEYFKATWKSEFNIRIGITSGSCYCGFFPSGTKGNYSINGTTANLCSRLCDAAPANTVCTTKSFLIKIESLFDNLKITKMDLNNVLKGFENSTPQLFYVQQSDTQKIQKNDFGICPLCESDLELNESNDQFNLVKCTKCQYSDVFDQEPHKQAS